MTLQLDDETESRLLDRAEYVEEAVTVLASKQSLSPEDYRSDHEQWAVVEREFQIAIEACIDIAGILIAARHGIVADHHPEEKKDETRERNRTPRTPPVTDPHLFYSSHHDDPAV